MVSKYNMRLNVALHPGHDNQNRFRARSAEHNPHDITNPKPAFNAASPAASLSMKFRWLLLTLLTEAISMPRLCWIFPMRHGLSWKQIPKMHPEDAAFTWMDCCLSPIHSSLLNSSEKINLKVPSCTRVSLYLLSVWTANNLSPMYVHYFPARRRWFGAEAEKNGSQTWEGACQKCSPYRRVS